MLFTRPACSSARHVEPSLSGRLPSRPQLSKSDHKYIRREVAKRSVRQISKAIFHHGGNGETEKGMVLVIEPWVRTCERAKCGMLRPTNLVLLRASAVKHVYWEKNNARLVTGRCTRIKRVVVRSDQMIRSGDDGRSCRGREGQPCPSRERGRSRCRRCPRGW
jgi:hypothetical protein